MVTINLQRSIAAPPERVFAWLADPSSLATIALVRHASWAPDSPPPASGAVRAVTGWGMWFHEKITAYDPPNNYSYLIIGSFPAFDHDGGTLTFTQSREGTHVDWTTTYTHPARAGGKAMEAVSFRLLSWSFGKILDNCADALER
jgi:uncharacterized protein YndB with AHSA1/START domain